MDRDLAIHAQGLTKTYKNLTAVNKLDLAIPRGTVYGFLGPNGAGKTTTIRMLLGLIEPTAGNAKVLGHDIKTERDAISKKVGAIVESPAFYTYLSGMDNLRTFAHSSGVNPDPKRLDELIDWVGLTDRAKDKVKTYSLGMKQRLGIAATLLANPEVIFLDEPTNGLDPKGTVEMRHLIADLGRRGHTIFLSSHILYEVEQVCSDVAIIQNGVTMAHGRVSDLLNDGGGFALEVAPIHDALRILQRHPELKATSNDNRWITIAAEPKDIPALMRLLVGEGIDVYQVQVRQRSLESFFLELTGSPTQPSSMQPNQPKVMEIA